MRVHLEDGTHIDVEGNYVEIASDGSLLVGTKTQQESAVAAPNGMRAVTVTQRFGRAFRRDLWREVEPIEVEAENDGSLDLLPHLAGAVN